MKNFTLILIGIITFFLLATGSLFSQNQAGNDNLYYVVIGAFANPRNAAEFMERAKTQSLNARSSISGPRKLHYVYILETPDREVAITQVMKLRKELTYSETWVYRGLLGYNPLVIEFEKKELVETKTKPDSTIAVTTVVTEIIEPKVEPEIVKDGSKPFIFRLKSIDTGLEVEGDIDIFDADIKKGRKIVSYRGNDVVNVKPVNKSGNLAIVCDLFGYRKIQIPINFDKPKIEDAVSLKDGNVVVTFDLVQLKKGDKVVMYNVYFFNQTAIMRPESSFEIGELLKMMKERPTTKIRIHGHTNGNGFGKIVTLGNSKEFFSLSSDNDEDQGSAVKLSEERAKVIKTYLTNAGIDAKRMDVKAWGGKKPIYDENHSLAQANVRVDIEILEE